jgi:hypothetical protein
MTLVQKISELLFPPDTPEKRVIREFHLRKDTDSPFRYWLNESSYIEFDSRDPVSLERARMRISEYYRNPQIRRGSPRTARNIGQRVPPRPLLDLDTSRIGSWMWGQDSTTGKSAARDLRDMGIETDPQFDTLLS